MDSCLYNIDLSNNDYLSKSIEQIELLRKIIEETTLYSLDLSHILFGVDPNKILKQYEKDPNSLNDYQKKVFDLKKKLDHEQTIYTKIIGDINSNKADKEKYEEKLRINNLFEGSREIDDEINDIVKDSNSKYPIFLKEKAKTIIKNNVEFFENNENFQNLEFKKKEQKIVEYMSYKRTENDLNNLLEKKGEKKLIII